MNHLSRLLTVSVWIALSFSAWGDEDPNWMNAPAEIKATCKKVKDLKIPEADRPSAEEKKSLESCDAEELYYGFGSPPEPLKAKKCAILSDDESVQSTVLAMVYANGKGAARNLDLAIHFACMMGGAPAEIEYRIQHLLEIQKTKPKDPGFDYCDDITSGMMAGVCRQKEKRFADAKLQAKFNALISKWSPTERKEFEKLKVASKNFTEARAGNEVDLSGTMRSAFVIAEEDIQERDFFESLEKFEKKKAPKYTSAQLKSADQQLNETYKTIQNFKPSDEYANPESIDYGTVTKSGVKIAQIAWIKYRDAWVEFAKVKYPSVPSDSVSAWFTVKRNHMLRSLMPR